MSTPYDEEFFQSLADGSTASAQIVLPFVMRLLEPRRVVDVGCGVGTWAAVAAKSGAESILGIDGNYVDRAQLQIPQDRFLAADLTADVSLQESFDLAICLEVAEHLPESAADRFVATLCKLAPAVLFSAAIPFQEGTDHINLQWPSYWVRRFEAEQFACFDILRSKFWNNQDVEVWYRQNMLLFANIGTDVERKLNALGSPVTSGDVMDIVHPQHFEYVCTSKEFGVGKIVGLRALLTALPGAMARSVSYRLGGGKS